MYLFRTFSILEVNGKLNIAESEEKFFPIIIHVMRVHVKKCKTPE